MTGVLHSLSWACEFLVLVVYPLVGERDRALEKRVLTWERL